VNYDDGKAFKLAVSQADSPILHLLCGAHPTIKARSIALPCVFDTNGGRRATTYAMLELLLANSIEEGPAIQTLKPAIRGGFNLDIVEQLTAADARLSRPAFQYAIALNSVSQKEPILKSLLRKGLARETLGQALITKTRQATTTNETRILRLLLEHRAFNKYNNGEALVLSVTSGNSALVKVVLSRKNSPSQASITTAFRILFNNATTGSGYPHTANTDRFEVVSELLSRGVEQSDAPWPYERCSTLRTQKMKLS
jgi:hypothetical protein